MDYFIFIYGILFIYLCCIFDSIFSGFKLSELDEWMSDRESGEDDDVKNEEKEHKPEKKNSKSTKRKGKIKRKQPQNTSFISDLFS